MKPFKIARNSWHFNLATRYGFIDEYRFDGPESTPDFCKYVQSVLAGFALAVGITFLLSVVFAFFVGFPILNIIIYIQYGYIIDLELMFFIVAIYIALINGCIFLNEESIQKRHNARYQKYLREKTQPPEPSFTQLCYKKFKEKTCFKIEVV